MNSGGSFIQEMLVLYLIALLGFIVRKRGILNEHADEVLTQLVLYITLPSLILFSLDIPFSIHVIHELLWLIFMSIYILVISILLAAKMRKSSTLPEHQKKVYEGLTIFGNQGFIGYAVSFILLKEQGIVYLTMFNICYLILIWSYGIHIFTKTKDKINWRKIFWNPGIIATFTGLIVLFLPYSWPQFISKPLESIGKMTIPLSMMMIGSLLAKVNYKEVPLLLKNVYLWKSAMTKLIFIPLCLLLFITLKAPFSLLMIAIIISGMPSAPTISFYAQKYGGDTIFASTGVLLTTLLCLLTIPLLYFLLSILY
ncbi:AEC family transporter [Lederbergia wuyishanensis]|uniref:Permease n=1 Tax=Lederbergia wuyishanensis TaxID=1347903 RepID=A0ABU0D6Q8_9BACI|nr:AEC family transporter [Lederbergia wuyishanensis]MCJ8008564.1 AEC family transporter [Lederbergia wuyishanensis]MDQ0344021.1 putative permease [Lederbergia wuyishanensis]